jgi:hypothetical protein
MWSMNDVYLGSALSDQCDLVSGKAAFTGLREPSSARVSCKRLLGHSDPRWLGQLRDNNRAENSHLSIRRRQKNADHQLKVTTQRFLEAHGLVDSALNIQ